MTKANHKKTAARSAKTGKMVTAAYAKRHKATTVKEKREEVLWRGWLDMQIFDGPGEIRVVVVCKTRALSGGTSVPVKVVRA